eukprot:CAMPEP_0184302246 /NCGR_PEP_ID=MMETSP1049-20130417/12277_1 /TAXON_ID=77928 /ORGANISM="Proteomonas sulcata, Strain CCMP704" /LENGTH=86 /DNA_ID=CAMNT_0026613493 /DNA_START=150 /DNA_END=410 /DNA_ORIENTATION=-
MELVSLPSILVRMLPVAIFSDALAVPSGCKVLTTKVPLFNPSLFSRYIPTPANSGGLTRLELGDLSAIGEVLLPGLRVAKVEVLAG